MLLGLAANMLLFFAMFRLLGRARHPAPVAVVRRALGALGFEVAQAALRRCCSRATKGCPAFQAFGIALILLVWINYFSRVIMYAAAWAHTSREARAARTSSPRTRSRARRRRGSRSGRPTSVWPPTAGAPAVGAGVRRGSPAFAAGRGTALALVALVAVPRGGTMSFERKHGWIIAAIAAWNVFIWITFAKNLSQRTVRGGPPTGYWVAHTVLIDRRADHRRRAVSAGPQGRCADPSPDPR